MSRNKYPQETIDLILDVSQRLFLEKGFEETTLQDIINELGGLTKGAIYTHFKSKEEIFWAVVGRMDEEGNKALEEIRDDIHLTAKQKLTALFGSTLSRPANEVLYTVKLNLMENPKLLANQVSNIFKYVAPMFIEPILKQGIEDGSLNVKSPKETAEVIMLLVNVWLNPCVILSDIQSVERKIRLFGEILSDMGVDIVSEELINSYIEYEKIFIEVKSSTLKSNKFKGVL